MTPGTTQRTIASRGKEAIRRFIPSALLKERRIIQQLGPKAGRVYTRLRLLDALGIRTSNQRMAPQSARSFLFVCYGNIMRSAMAEFFLRHALREAGLEQQVRIMSAGLHASGGREAHLWAQEASADLGISLAEHRARPLTRQMVEQADCILAMDFQNQAELLTLYPEARDKIYMLSAYGESHRQYRQIPDPYLSDLGATRLCGRQLQACIRNLVTSTFPSSVAFPTSSNGAAHSRTNLP